MLPLHLARKENGVDLAANDGACHFFERANILWQAPFIYAQFVKRGASLPQRVGQRFIALAVVDDSDVRSAQVQTSHPLEQIVARERRCRGDVRRESVPFQSRCGFRAAAGDGTALEGFNSKRELSLPLDFLQQCCGPCACEKYVYLAAGSLQALQKTADDLLAIERRLAHGGRRPHDTTVTAHELCELATHARLEQRHADAVESLRLWRRHRR